MVSIDLRVPASVLEEIIDGSRVALVQQDTPIRIKNLLDYFDSTEERVILWPLRNHSMLLELVTYILFPHFWRHHHPLAPYFSFYMTHRLGAARTHLDELRNYIDSSSLPRTWKDSLIHVLTPIR